ncbi:MAG: gluconokinase [Candidatus Melainabacteria bacterium]|nr:gluconokinase [Candidatus Melainabacteria bacterium]
MGVAGSGKTTVGKLLAERLNWKFADADDYHPSANVIKMSAGHALTDEDRAPWLQTLHDNIENWTSKNEATVLACSALKASYRELLQLNDSVSLVYLRGDYGLFEKRLSGRQGHFMKTTMLESQFQTLEEPVGAVTVDASQDPESIVKEICIRLSLN